MNRTRAWPLAVVVGLAVGAGTRTWLVDEFVFAGVLAVVYAIGTRLFVEYAPSLPALETDGWRATRWNVAFTVFVSFVAILTVSVVPVGSFALRVALLVFVGGVGWTGMFFGVAITRAKFSGDRSVDETEPTSERSAVSPERS